MPSTEKCVAALPHLDDGATVGRPGLVAPHSVASLATVAVISAGLNRSMSVSPWRVDAGDVFAIMAATLNASTGFRTAPGTGQDDELTGATTEVGGVREPSLWLTPSGDDLRNDSDGGDVALSREAFDASDVIGDLGCSEATSGAEEGLRER
jgi:hypothetical protein